MPGDAFSVTGDAGDRLLVVQSRAHATARRLGAEAPWRAEATAKMLIELQRETAEAERASRTAVGLPGPWATGAIATADFAGFLACLGYGAAGKSSLTAHLASLIAGPMSEIA